MRNRSETGDTLYRLNTEVLLFIFFQRGAKMMWIILGVAVVIALTIPDVLDAIAIRFAGEDMVDGNGRIGLILKFYELWLGNPITVLFGVGLFNCNVHCTPLQFLFGGGIVLFALVIVLLISYIPKTMNKNKIASGLPFLITVGMMLTIPAAGLLNTMFPLVYVGLCSECSASRR